MNEFLEQFLKIVQYWKQIHPERISNENLLGESLKDYIVKSLKKCLKDFFGGNFERCSNEIFCETLDGVLA